MSLVIHNVSVKRFNFSQAVVSLFFASKHQFFAVFGGATNLKRPGYHGFPLPFGRGEGEFYAAARQFLIMLCRSTENSEEPLKRFYQPPTFQRVRNLRALLLTVAMF